MNTITCPHCGASVRITRRNSNDIYECEYCNSLLSGINSSMDISNNTPRRGAAALSANRNVSVSPAAYRRPVGTSLHGIYKVFVVLFILLFCIVFLIEGLNAVKKTNKRRSENAKAAIDAVVKEAAVTTVEDPDEEMKAQSAQNTIYPDSSETSESDTTGKTTTEKYVEDVYLTELLCIKKGRVSIDNKSTEKMNTGEEYSHYLYAEGPYEEVFYKLNGDYSRLTAVWAIDSYYKNTESINGMEIYADGELVYTAPMISGGDLPTYIDVDITGCDVLSIMFTKGEGCAILGDVRLSNPDRKIANPATPNPSVLPCWLTDLDYLTDNGVEVCSSNPDKTNTGEIMPHYITGRAGEEIEYYLRGQYSAISGFFAIMKYYKNTTQNNSFAIYADDQLVYASPSITGGDLPQYFEKIPINNAQKLKIVFLEGDYEAGIANLRLYP